MTDDSMSEEDKALFREHMRAVKPLNKKTERISQPKTSLPVRPPKRQTPPATSNKEYFLSDFISDTVLSNTVLSYSIPSLPTKRFRELKNGQIHWEARLDLHGFKTEPARDSLCEFIQNQSQNDKRCVLIIHGKGGHQGAPPMIKNLINRWLPQLNEVLAFHSALPKDGGHGAVYVLLKRNRTDKEYEHDLR